jgi:site-specific recombinase XerD
MGGARVQQVRLPSGAATWTVIGGDGLSIDAAEEYLEYLRVSSSPNTVKSYARALALWWRWLQTTQVGWHDVGLSEFTGFVHWLRTGDDGTIVAFAPSAPKLSESTVAVRLQAVLSFYRYQALNGVPAAVALTQRIHRSSPQFRPLLEHVARRRGRPTQTVRVRAPRREIPPVFTPGQMTLIKDACADVDPSIGEYVGSVRDRLLFELLECSGMRLGEALGLLHGDWVTGRGDTPYVNIIPREHPHGQRVKSGLPRRIYVTDRVDRLYGEYLWQLCDAGADVDLGDMDRALVFVNVAGGEPFAPWKPGSVYSVVARLKRTLKHKVPAGWTPHWSRHTHAAALLLAGVPLHVVSRRLGHADVQTTMNLYGWVTDDDELRALADWQRLTATWERHIAA